MTGNQTFDSVSRAERRSLCWKQVQGLVKPMPWLVYFFDWYGRGVEAGKF